MDPLVDAPEQSMRTIRHFIPRKLQPVLRGFRKRWQLRKLRLSEPFRSVYPYTTGAMIRQQNLYRLAQDVETNRIPGAIVECGVLDGGTAALMASATKNRPVHLFDSWEGLPNPTEKDTDAASIWVGQVVGSPRRVIAIMRKLGVDLSRLSFHKGWFDQTFPKVNIDRIALLHIDADFYESVKLCLDKWAG
jgi:O-methyltransferase